MRPERFWRLLRRRPAAASTPPVVHVVGQVTRSPRRSAHDAVLDGHRVPKVHLGIAVLSGLDRPGVEVRIARPGADQLVTTVRWGDVVEVTGELRRREFVAATGERHHHVLLAARDVAVCIPRRSPEPA